MKINKNIVLHVFGVSLVLSMSGGDAMQPSATYPGLSLQDVPVPNMSDKYTLLRNILSYSSYSPQPFELSSSMPQSSPTMLQLSGSSHRYSAKGYYSLQSSNKNMSISNNSSIIYPTNLGMLASDNMDNVTSCRKLKKYELPSSVSGNESLDDYGQFYMQEPSVRGKASIGRYMYEMLFKKKLEQGLSQEELDAHVLKTVATAKRCRKDSLRVTVNTILREMNSTLIYSTRIKYEERPTINSTSDQSCNDLNTQTSIDDNLTSQIQQHTQNDDQLAAETIATTVLENHNNKRKSSSLFSSPTSLTKKIKYSNQIEHSSSSSASNTQDKTDLNTTTSQSSITTDSSASNTSSVSSVTLNNSTSLTLSTSSSQNNSLNTQPQINTTTTSSEKITITLPEPTKDNSTKTKPKFDVSIRLSPSDELIDLTDDDVASFFN